jgi:hypothetical protein
MKYLHEGLERSRFLPPIARAILAAFVRRSGVVFQSIPDSPGGLHSQSPHQQSQPLLQQPLRRHLE